MPDRPSDLQLAPWEAVLAQALQQDEPERTALEVIQAAQDFTTHTGHLLQLVEAFWHLDVEPQIDEMVRQRITPAEYERYLTDPERPAFLQALRAHEIGGRRIEDVLDSITAEPLTGLRSIAAGLHGRAGKEPAPPRGATTRWAERPAPGQVTPTSTRAGPMLDARQADARRAAGRQAAAVGAGQRGAIPAVRAGAELRRLEEAGMASSSRTGKRPGSPTRRRRSARCRPGRRTSPRRSTRPCGRCELPDEAALLKAMGQGELEAAVDEHDRALALAPPTSRPR